MQDWSDSSFETQMQAAQKRQELHPLLAGCPTCEQKPWISVFFDGTGNNGEIDADKKKWSNIYRLFQGHADDQTRGIFPIYIPGPGTPLSVSNAGWLSKLRDSGALGGGFGLGMDARMDKAFKLFSRNLADCQRVSRIDIAIFGFSRGATLARAWINLLLKECIWEKGKPHWRMLNAKNGVSAEICIRYVGLFDTVESVGMVAKNWSPSQCMTLPNVVERCVHYVSAHELRGAFPLTTVADAAGAPPGEERVWPGMHSDVGGGYRPNEQGRFDTLSRLPLNAMRLDAYLAGVPFLSPAELKGNMVENKHVFDYFEYDAELKNLYDHYKSQISDASSDLDRTIISHMKLYYGWMKLRQDGDIDSLYGKVREERADLAKELENELSDQRKYLRKIPFENLSRKENVEWARLKISDSRKYREKLESARETYGKNFRPYELNSRQLTYWDAWEKSVVPDEKITKFFDFYVHDSRAGFTFNSGDYLEPREVLERKVCSVEPAQRTRKSVASDVLDQNQ
ncbi:phospholipase effector Tle1 domain-containing protein [Chromobacterium violaceum]|uniref:phospholipase effector Tle1 domain-containing protein n=1 Tax=Chromobacterium violaceum TaxID=536 RepID=UPI0015F8936B|nr:DUF2235 domain-containing protein [Chromobacterium violaceum]MBA8733528.1 DUF2235 domain-containing protein [Chromobacterium violaceum]